MISIFTAILALAVGVYVGSIVFGGKETSEKTTENKSDKELPPEDFVNRVAYHMGLPEDQYNRITYAKLNLGIRVDFDGGSPELHQVSCCVELTEDAARKIGRTFATRYRRALEAKDGR